MRQLLRDNGLSIVLVALFLVIWLGQAMAGHSVYNEEQLEHGREAISFFAYLFSPHFIEATAENWESEFLQMAAYVSLTAILYQRGSAESKSPDRPHDVDEEPRSAELKPEAPWPLHQGRLIRTLYSYSLSIVLALLFLFAFTSHIFAGARLNNETRLDHALPPQSILEYLASSQFWFESLQNWQSEFLAVFAVAFLSIFLRHKGSPESKPIAMPNQENP